MIGLVLKERLKTIDAPQDSKLKTKPSISLNENNNEKQTKNWLTDLIILD